MRVAYILPALKNRGPVIFTRILIAGLLHESGLEMEVFYLKKGKGIDFPVKCSQLTIGNVYKLFDFDLVHSTGFLPDCILALLPIARKRKIASLHGFIWDDMTYTYPRWKAKTVSRLWFLALRSISNLIYSSTFMAAHYRSFIGARNDVIINYGIPPPAALSIELPDQLVFDRYKARSLKIIGAVCLVIKRKGLDQLVRALVQLTDCAVVIVGEGTESILLLDLAKSLGVSDRFTILGFRETSSRYNCHFDLFAMVSRSEGYCLAMLEAMGCGLPLVCSRLPIYADLLSEEDLGFFQLENTQSLVLAIKKVTSKPANYMSSSKRLYKESFQLSVMASRHFAYYSSLTGDASE
ncbi:MAG: glycosyltransferase family 4 protein [Terriglobales bacterium]|jgi:L-malate glycosyltransferase